MKIKRNEVSDSAASKRTRQAVAQDIRYARNKARAKRALCTERLAARIEFNKAIASETDPGKVARLELCREYFTNPAFKLALEDYIFALNQKQANRAS